MMHELDTPSIAFTGERVVPMADANPLQRSLLNIHQAIYRSIGQYCRDKVVLDIGCGTGHGMYRLYQDAAGIWGTDIASDAITFLSQRFPLLQPKVLVSDALHIGLGRQMFDVITAVEVIEHVPSDIMFLREIKRLLKPDGLCCISTPNRLVHSPSSIVPQNPFHIREYTASELYTLLSQEFKQVTVLGVMIRERGFLIRYHDSQGLNPVLPFPLSSSERFLFWRVTPWRDSVVQVRHVEFVADPPPHSWGLLAVCSEPYPI
jgi:2-polyprenyl-3-methyl-5-hydroxy-6-metoxy-1,4-benzoquinol methylase